MSKILIVEDDNVLAKAIITTLTEAGFETALSVDGEDALIQAKEFKPDLILLDLILPKLAGEEVLAALKVDVETHNIPVLVSTVKEDSEAIERCVTLGARGYFIKAHYTLTEVVEQIKKTLKEEGE